VGRIHEAVTDAEEEGVSLVAAEAPSEALDRGAIPLVEER